MLSNKFLKKLGWQAVIIRNSFENNTSIFMNPSGQNGVIPFFF